MDIKLKITLSLFSLLLGFINIVSSQNYEEIAEAFKSSYLTEESGEYSQAINDMKEVYDSDSYEINLRLGWLYYKAAKFTESEVYYQRAINLMPYSIEPRLGIIYPKSVLGKWDEVINIYNDLLESFPHNSLVHYQLGMVYYEKQNFEKALVHFNQVVELWPFDYDGLLMYAHTNAKLGKIREAKVLYYKVLMLVPNDESAKEGLELIEQN